MSGLVGCIEAVAKDFDDTDPKNVGDGIKNCMRYEEKIKVAEEEKAAEGQKVTIQDGQDLENLTNDIRRDMGENVPEQTDGQVLGGSSGQEKDDDERGR